MPISPRLLEELRPLIGRSADRPTISSLARRRTCPCLEPPCRKPASWRRRRRVSQERHATHVATFVRDRTFRSGGRLDGHQQAAGAQQFLNDHDLLALPPSTLQLGSQSDRLAAHAAMSAVGRSDAADSAADTARAGRGQQHPALTVASILKQYTAPFIERHHDHLSCHVESTLLRIGFCRTAPMKGHVYRCPSCDSKVPVYNSCTDRHCPQCRGATRADWVDKTAQLLRDDTNYFQVVFTLPDKLSSLVLATNAHSTSCCSAVRRVPCNDRSMTNAGCKLRRRWCCTLGISDWDITHTCMRWFPAAARRWTAHDGRPDLGSTVDRSQGWSRVLLGAIP